MDNKLVKNLSEYGSKQEWIKDSLIRVTFDQKEDFLKIKETLTRIGIQPKFSEKVLYQSCHILHKKIDNNGVFDSAYFIVHFKELFVLDGKNTTLTDEDIVRRNNIAKILEDWKLVKIVNPKVLDTKGLELNPKIKIIKFSEKNEWTLKTKYTIGSKKK